MPIQKDIRRKHYGKEWQQLSKRLRTVRAGNKCEWCHAENYKPHPVTKSKVILTVAHFNHITGDDREENLVVLCQRCHLSLDRQQHVENAKKTWAKKREQAIDERDAARPFLTMQ